jgi:transcriptional regulator with XRE-family HTH domain
VIITSELIRAARALLRWEQKDLAEASKVSLPSIKRLESQFGPLAAQSRTVAALCEALERAGVEFTNGEKPGVRSRGWKWRLASYDVSGTRLRWVRYYPVFEALVVAAEALMTKRARSERPTVHLPLEATDAQKDALRKLGLPSILSPRDEFNSPIAES